MTGVQTGVSVTWWSASGLVGKWPRKVLRSSQLPGWRDCQARCSGLVGRLPRPREPQVSERNWGAAAGFVLEMKSVGAEGTGGGIFVGGFGEPECVKRIHAGLGWGDWQRATLRVPQKGIEREEAERTCAVAGLTSGCRLKPVLTCATRLRHGFYDRGVAYSEVGRC